jgi:hypothetical protein
MTSLVVLSNRFLPSLKGCGNTGPLSRGLRQRGDTDNRGEIDCA